MQSDRSAPLITFKKLESSASSAHKFCSARILMEQVDFCMRMQVSLAARGEPTSAKERGQPAKYNAAVVGTPSELRAGDVRYLRTCVNKCVQNFLQAQKTCTLCCCGEWMRGPLATGLKSRRRHSVHTKKNNRRYVRPGIPWFLQLSADMADTFKDRFDNTSMWASTGGKLPRRAATATRAFRPTSASFDIQVRALRLGLQSPEREDSVRASSLFGPSSTPSDCHEGQATRASCWPGSGVSDNKLGQFLYACVFRSCTRVCANLFATRSGRKRMDGTDKRECY